MSGHVSSSQALHSPCKCRRCTRVRASDTMRAGRVAKADSMLTACWQRADSVLTVCRPCPRRRCTRGHAPTSARRVASQTRSNIFWIGIFLDFAIDTVRITPRAEGHTGHMCGEPDEIELTAAYGLFYHPLLQARASRRSRTCAHTSRCTRASRPSSARQAWLAQPKPLSLRAARCGGGMANVCWPQLAACWPCADRVLAVCWPCAGGVLVVCSLCASRAVC